MIVCCRLQHQLISQRFYKVAHKSPIVLYLYQTYLHYTYSVAFFGLDLDLALALISLFYFIHTETKKYCSL